MIGVIAAMPEELAALRALMQECEPLTLAGKTAYRGTLSGKPIILALSGIGKVNAAALSTLLLTQYQLTAVINIGSAGGIDARVKIGDVVVANQVAHHDVDLRAFGYKKGQLPDLPLFFLCDKNLCALAEKAAAAFDSATVHQGLIVSGDQFVDGGDKLTQIRRHFEGVLACEMEAAAIGQICYQAAVPFVVIRALSDHADVMAESQFDAFIEQASKQSAEMVARLLALL